jgi:hypothetical protein
MEKQLPELIHHSSLIHQGKSIFDEIPKYASSYVGHKRAWDDCHIQSGAAASAAPFLGYFSC